MTPRTIRRALTLVLLLCSAAWLLAPTLADTPASQPAGKRPGVGDKAADFSLNGLDDASVKLSDLEAKGPVVLVVLRGFPGYQCPFCTKQVHDFIASAKAFSARSAQVLLVYPGPADDLKAHAKDFLQSQKLPDNFTLVIDPAYDFTNLYGLRWDAPHETAYPSTFVIDGSGVVRFAKIAHVHAGRATAAEVLTALDALDKPAK